MLTPYSPPARRYPARVQDYNPRTGEHTLEYEDGNEVEDLRKSAWEMQVFPDPQVLLGPSFLTFVNKEDVSDSDSGEEEVEEVVVVE